MTDNRITVPVAGITKYIQLDRILIPGITLVEVKMVSLVPAMIIKTEKPKIIMYIILSKCFSLSSDIYLFINTNLIWESSLIANGALINENQTIQKSAASSPQGGVLESTYLPKTTQDTIITCSTKNILHIMFTILNIISNDLFCNFYHLNFNLNNPYELI